MLLLISDVDEVPKISKDAVANGKTKKKHPGLTNLDDVPPPPFLIFFPPPTPSFFSSHLFILFICSLSYVSSFLTQS